MQHYQCGAGQRQAVRVQGSASHGYKAAPLTGTGQRQAVRGITLRSRRQEEVLRQAEAEDDAPHLNRPARGGPGGRAACGKPRGQCGPEPGRAGEPRSATPRPQARRQAPATAPPPGALGPREPRAGPLRCADPGLKGGGS